MTLVIAALPSICVILSATADVTLRVCTFEKRLSRIRSEGSDESSGADLIVGADDGGVGVTDGAVLVESPDIITSVSGDAGVVWLWSAIAGIASTQAAVIAIVKRMENRRIQKRLPRYSGLV